MMNGRSNGFRGRVLAPALFMASLSLGIGTAAAQAPQANDGAGMLKSLQNDPAMPSVAPAGYDVTIVVFSDYQCPYCRKLHGSLKQLMRQDRKVRIVYRDWPIFGAASVEAARSALAARYQGKHAAFNEALMATSGRLDSQAIQLAAQRAGVDVKRLKSDLVSHKGDIDAALARTARFADLMNLSGTPALVIGSYLLPGAATPEMLGDAVAMVRKSS
ncbi:MAG: DsbA family protein [Novosphingobium pentaromativorans]|uniref:DsbA family protein n=1 Tax=Novosphingobium pentaromativorans TaxID=205844 RepID=A0A2W5NSJ0_9SPHN|nr:MAG: DsbA family protein [Novosphingobium pentaromativorans]